MPCSAIISCTEWQPTFYCITVTSYIKFDTLVIAFSKTLNVHHSLSKMKSKRLEKYKVNIINKYVFILVRKKRIDFSAHFTCTIKPCMNLTRKHKVF